MSKGRFRKKNFKDEVIEDFGKVCVNQCISKQAVYDMAWRVSWEWTDTIGRYINCKYWSKDALDYLTEGLTPDANGNYKKQSKLNEKVEKYVVHEHVVPRKYFIDYIMRCYDNYKAPEIEQLNKMFACIVSKTDNGKLNINYKSEMPDADTLEDVKNPWQRYIKSGIKEIYEVNWDDNIIKPTLINIENFNIEGTSHA